MQLQIKQKMFSIGDKFAVTNESEEPVFFVQGKFFSLRGKRSIFDLEGNLLLVVQRKLFKLMPTFEVYNANKVRIATIKKRVSFVSKFKIFSQEDTYQMDGDFFGWNFVLSKNNQPVGTLNKKLFKLTDTYILDIVQDEEAPFFVALTLALDLMKQRRRNNSRR